MNNGSKIAKIIAIVIAVELVFTMIIRVPLAKALGLTSDFKFDLSIFEPKETTESTSNPNEPTKPNEPTESTFEPSSTENPDSNPIATPTKVPTPTGTSEEVTEENKAKILTWDFNPNYEKLDYKEKQVYVAIYKCLLNAEERVDLREYRVKTDKINQIIENIYDDHPELFWFDGLASSAYDPTTGYVLYTSPIYNELQYNLEEHKKKFDECAEKYLAAAKAETRGAVYQELVVHNMMCKAVTYDLKSELNQTTYSCLVNGRTVCAGYARSFQYLMLKLGINIYYVYGDGDNGKERDTHAWNIIVLDGKTYQVDVTWDDTDNKQVKRFDYFNLTDEKMLKDHFYHERCKDAPKCTSDDMSYDKIAAAA